MTPQLKTLLEEVKDLLVHAGNVESNPYCSDCYALQLKIQKHLDAHQINQHIEGATI